LRPKKELKKWGNISNKYSLKILKNGRIFQDKVKKILREKNTTPESEFVIRKNAGKAITKWLAFGNLTTIKPIILFHPPRTSQTRPPPSFTKASPSSAAPMNSSKKPSPGPCRRTRGVPHPQRLA